MLTAVSAIGAKPAKVGALGKTADVMQIMKGLSDLYSLAGGPPIGPSNIAPGTQGVGGPNPAMQGLYSKYGKGRP